MEINNASADKLNQCKEDILKGISQTYDFCEQSNIFDEYTYILLWRPIEWIIDYALLEHFIKKKKDLTEDEINAYIKEYKKKGVDRKVREVKNAENPENVLILLKDNIYKIDYLRRCRNGVIYHYIKEDNNINPFNYFDDICEAFILNICPGHEYKRVSSPNYRIQLSDLASIYKLNIDQVYGRLKNIIDYLKVSKHNRVISICKMEELAQLIAYNILINDLHKKITHIKGNKKGIYVDNHLVSSYIDCLKKEVSKSNLLSFKKISLDLHQLRKNRNNAIHVLEVTAQMEEDFRTVWAVTINNYFGYDERITHLLEPELLKASFQKSIRNLNSYSNYYNRERTHQLIVSMENFSSLIVAAMGVASDVYDKYSDRFENLKEEEADELYREMSEKIASSVDKIFDDADNETREKYKKNAIEKFGANYNENNNAYRCLETALLLFDAGGILSSDYAGICIELTRALEIYLYNKISNKINEYLIENGDDSLNLDSRTLQLIRDGKPTLGTYRYLYRSHTDAGSQAFLSFCIDEGIYLDNNSNSLGEELLYEMDTIDKIREAYRNRIAHRDIINEEDMLNCVKDIIEGQGPIVCSSTNTIANGDAILKRLSQKMGDIEASA